MMQQVQLLAIGQAVERLEKTSENAKETVLKLSENQKKNWAPDKEIIVSTGVLITLWRLTMFSKNAIQHYARLHMADPLFSKYQNIAAIVQVMLTYHAPHQQIGDSGIEPSYVCCSWYDSIETDLCTPIHRTP